tara:strand:- start:38756 stop:39838 length:1083 start_codon:yes stop_codon:yes gene_type:complete
MVALSVSYKTIQAETLPANIGNIFELRGNAKVIRDKDYDAELKFGIRSLDDVRTSNGRVAITFLDDSTVRITEHSKLIINEYIYDPNPSKSKVSLNFASGTLKFVTGKLASIDKENISIKTPSADISIRGTSFTTTVDELGRSLIILLPDENGLPSGEIVVSTLAGSVVLNQPYQATTTNVYETPPSKPVILDLNANLINNMLIVSPPKKQVVVEETYTNTVSDPLDFLELDIDYLNEDFLDAESELDFTELDIDYLDVNFFEDLLDIIDEIDQLNDDELESQFANNIVQGTNLGQDLETNITTILTGDTISLRRTVNQSVQLDLDSGLAYTVIFIQDGKSNQIIVNGGGTSRIRIIQSS